jgi:drug/metabolite transporter (DMT)-like permease
VSQSVFLAVLVAAFMHAAWNAIIKAHGDRFASITQLGIGQGLLGLALTPFFPLPADEIWFWIAASAFLHTAYKLFLVRAYQAGDLAQVYPLARGAAPLITALVAYFALNETMSPLTTAGVIVLCLGIGVMAMKGGGLLASLDLRAVRAALIVSLFIAAYTMVDGVGARLSESFAAYIVWMFALDGAAMTVVYLFHRGRGGAPALREKWPTGAGAAVISFSAYWLIIWAMTEAPIAAVAALREVSILFALGISTLLLKEHATVWRLGAAACIVAGVVVIRVG